MENAAVRKKKAVGLDLTNSPIFKTLLVFSIPIILANLIQQLYSMVDLIVIGQYVGSTGTVGVSTGGEIADLITPVAMGFATAGQIYIAQLAGAKDDSHIKSTVNTLITFMMIVSIALMAAAIIFCKPILMMLHCPAEAFKQAQDYMIITAIGFPFIFGYNAVCGILRGMGESKRPLLFISIAAVINIFGDIWLVAAFHLEAAGTAIATSASQAGSFIAALIFLYKHRDRFDFSMKLTNMKMNPQELGILVKLGIPQVIRSTLVRFSLLWINSNINVYGLEVSAVNSIGNKIQKFFDVFYSGVDTASAAMIGQNLGAKKKERASKTTWATFAMTMSSGAVIALLCLLFPKQIFTLFTTDAQVQTMGMLYMRLLVIHIFASCFVGTFQAMVTGCGFVSLGFAIGILDGVVCKVGLSLIFVNLMKMGYVGYFLGIDCSRILPGILCFWYFMSGKWKTRKLLTEQKHAKQIEQAEAD